MRIWMEVLFYMEGPLECNDLVLSVGPECGTSVTDIQGAPAQALGDNWYLWNTWWEIRPNPFYEDMTLILTTPETEPATIMIESWHVATECIPEPGTLALLGVGLAGLVIRRRRK